jgi:hypothetical protein
MRCVQDAAPISARHGKGRARPTVDAGPTLRSARHGFIIAGKRLYALCTWRTNDPVANGFGQGRFADRVMPAVDRDPAGERRGAAAGAMPQGLAHLLGLAQTSAVAAGAETPCAASASTFLRASTHIPS